MDRNDYGGPHVIVPRGFHFSLSKGFSARVCNVILWSCNAQNDALLAARLNRAVRLLRAACH
jgi:hypothetical protein